MRRWIKQFFSGSTQPAPSAAQLGQKDRSIHFKTQGDAHLGNGDFAAAAEEYRRAVALDPENAKALSNLGFALKEQGLFDEAEQALIRALAIDPTSAESHYLLGSLLLYRSQPELACAQFGATLELAPDFDIAYRDLCMLLFQLGRLEDAKQVVMRGIAHNPQSANLHFYLGNLHHAEQRFDLAIASFQRALSIEPERCEVLANLGLALLAQDQLEPAADSFRKALSLNPDSIDVYNNLGNVLHRQRQYEDAIACYRRGLSIDPQSANLQCNLGLALYAHGHVDEAIGHYRRAIEIDPNHADAYNNLGNALQSQKKTGEAIACYQRARQINPRNIDAHNNLAGALQSIGKLDDAVSCYQSALAIDPKHVSTQMNFGNALLDMAKHGEAAILFEKILHIAPAHIDAHFQLGAARQRLGQFDLAAENYRQVLELEPDSPRALVNLGVVLQENLLFDEAQNCYRRALQLDPDSVEAHVNLGNVHRSLGEHDSALASYRRALEIKPDLAIAHVNIGAVLQDLGQFDGAALSYRQALAIKPDWADAYVNLGGILQRLGKQDEAAACYRQAVAISPNSEETHNKLGSTLHGLGKADEAIVSYRKALQINPEYAEAHYNLGTVLNELHQRHDAATSLRNAVRINPDFADAHNNLASVLTDLGQFDDAMVSYRHALRIKPQFFEARSNLLFTRNYMPDQVLANLLEEAIEFGDLATQQAHPYRTWTNTRVTDRRLRIGMVSADFRHHPVGFFIEGVLKELTSGSSGSLELIAYSNSSCEDYLTERIKACVHCWQSVADCTDEDLARKIHDDEIDILIDLSGHTSHNRLPMFAWKPAPVQVSWLGYFATTGIRAIDYFVGDPWTLPDPQEVHFVEKIWRLPESRLSLTIPDIDVGISPLPCLANGYITFGCFNNLSKLNEPMVALWGKILRAVPESRLFLKAMQFADSTVRENVRARFAAHGIHENRILMEGFSTRPDYFSAYHRVDLALDTFPFTGGTTSAEGLWMGVPVLTLAGETLISRQGAGLLMNAGLSDWIAIDADDYVAKAVRHAEDWQRLAMLRKNLRGQVLNSPIFDTRRFARHFEKMLHDMWVKWCEVPQPTEP